MGFLGNLFGQAAGGTLGGWLGNRDTGASIGGALGNLLPFGRGGSIPPSMASVPYYQRGGKVKSKKSKVKKNKKSSK